MDWNHGNGSHGAYGFPHESSIHYFNGPSGEEDNGQDEGEVASGLNQCANGNTNLYETLIASQPRGNSSKIPGLHITTSESADKNANLEKAAKLREKLLASRRTGSRDVTPADNAKNTQLGANTSRPSQSRVPGLEELIREGREAAEKSAKQHGPLDVTQINVVEQQIDLASSAKPANNTKHQEHANGDMNVAPAAKVTISPMSNALEKARGTSDHGNVPHPGQAKNVQNVVDKRVPTAVRKDVGNDNHGVVSTVQSDRGVAHSHVDDAKGGVEETNGSVQLRPVKRLDGPLTNVSNDKVSAGFDPSILSNYFSDLSEWLEITGYHDLHLRQRTLNRHRRRLQLEQELAQLDQEDEEDRNIVSRSGPIGLLPAEPSSVTRTTGITSGSSAQPQRTARTAPSTGIADASASANLPSAPASDETHVRAKRPPSASSDVHRPEKQQRTEVNETSNMGNSLNRPSFRPPDNVAHARQPYSYSKRSQDDEHRRSTHENNYRLRYDPEYDRPTLKPSPHTWHVRASTADPFERDRYSEGGRSDPRAGAGSLFSSQRRFGNRRFNKSRGLTANVARNTLVKQPNTTNGKGNGKKTTSLHRF